jgi:hypothetical protein
LFRKFCNYEGIYVYTYPALDKKIDEIFERVVEPENSYGFIYSPLEFKIALNRNYRTGLTSITTADQDISNYHVAFHTFPEMKKLVHAKATQLMESGIFWFLYKNAYFPRDFTSKPEPIGPQVLSVAHLKAGFVIFCVLLGLSVVAFIVECTPKVLRKLFSLFLACYIVVKFTKMNKML